MAGTVGNPNPVRTPGFLEKAKETQFGGPRANPRNHDTPGANKTWSIKNQLRRLAAMEIDPDDKNAVKKLLPKNPTLAALTAAQTFIKATKGDMRAVEFVTERLDGKVPQVNINAEYEQIEDMTDEELDNAIDEQLRAREASRDALREEEAQRSAPDDGEIVRTTPAAVDAPGGAADGSTEQPG